MDELGNLTIDHFKAYTEEALRVYLSMRKKPIDGDYDTLVSRAFVASEEKVAVDVEMEERHRQTLSQYQQKLVIDGITLPDPFQLDSKSWISESKGGMIHWPSLYYLDISKYLDHINTPQDLLHRLDCEYKEGKGYRYFSGSFAKEIFWHPISQESSYCFLKNKVTPSHNTSSKPYNVWCVVAKDMPGKIGGQILSAYCSCTAGLLGSCNHVVALLFRVEAAVSEGFTKPTCTSRAAEWPVPPTTKSLLDLKPLTEIQFEKHHYLKKRGFLRTNEEAKKTFQEFGSSYGNGLNDRQNEELMRAKLYNVLKDTAPCSRFVEVMEKSKKRKTSNSIPATPSEIPPSPRQVAESFSSDSSITMEENVAKFTQILQITKEQITDIYNVTKFQSECQIWHSLRQGRITASLFHRVMSRTKTLINKPDEDADSLLKTLIDRAKFETNATKHGINMEPHAAKAVLSLLRKHHTKLIGVTPGMMVSEDHPFLGASADLEVSCSCHKGEDFLVEIKSPYTICHTIPTDENCSYLEKNEEDKTVLKRNHQYYSQIQGQLGITGKQYAYFFVYTHFGHHLEKIEFDQEYWDEMQKYLVYFWYNYLAPALLKLS